MSGESGIPPGQGNNSHPEEDRSSGWDPGWADRYIPGRYRPQGFSENQVPPPPPPPGKQNRKGGDQVRLPGPAPWVQPPVQYPGIPPQRRSSRFWDISGLKGRKIWLLIPFMILLMLLIVVLFVGRPYIVRGQSMEPTLHEGDRVFVIKYRFNTIPNRGDVVVLKGVPGTQEMIIKRVAGIAGDRIATEGDRVVVNGKYRYKNTNKHVSDDYDFLVPDDCIFVMGDNEAHSFDSRTFGPISMKKIVGKALLIFWPPGDFKVL